MTDFVAVFCTCSDAEEARRIANALVERRVAACVNILPGVESVYRWQGQIETATEQLLLIKTTRERFDALHDAIVELHSYETPEVLSVPVEAGSKKYLEWITENV